MNKLKDDILKKIKTGELQKKPQWIFLSKKYSLWSFSILSIIFGSLSFSLFLHNYFDSFGPWYKLKIENSFFWSNIFWIWIIFLGIFIFSTILNFRQTKNSFRYKISTIVLSVLTLTILIGWGLFEIKIGKYSDQYIMKHNKKYQLMKMERKKIIYNYLKNNNIDTEAFFKNKEIIAFKKENKKVDKERIDRLKKILESLKDQKNEKKIIELFEEIKKKKKNIDYLRFMKEIEIYNKK